MSEVKYQIPSKLMDEFCATSRRNVPVSQTDDGIFESVAFLFGRKKSKEVSITKMVFPDQLKDPTMSFEGEFTLNFIIFEMLL